MNWFQHLKSFNNLLIDFILKETLYNVFRSTKKCENQSIRDKKRMNKNVIKTIIPP